MSRLRWLVAAAVTVAVTFVPRAPATAQCVPDGLDSVPCCTPVTPIIPTIPSVSQSAKYICFRDCQTQLNANLCVTIDAPIATPVCGLYLIKFKVRQCGGTMPILFQGNLRAQYSRNWLEQPVAGANVGVWRFLLNGDMKATSTLTANPLWASPNVQPGCYSTYNQFYVAGYVDYAFDCTAATWTAAWAFGHECDRLHHPPGQPRPAPVAGFHPTRSWTFLGPGAGFVVDPTPVGTIVGNGPIGSEAFRWNDWSASPNICRGEEASTGNATPMGSFCSCGAPGGGQFENTDIAVAGVCGSQSRTSLPPALLLLQKRIGRWTNNAVFPGFEYLNLDMGDLSTLNSCTGLTTTEWYEGVTTLGGFPSMNYSGGFPGRTWMDLQSSNKSPGSMVRTVGFPHVSQFLLNLNMP